VVAKAAVAVDAKELLKEAVAAAIACIRDAVSPGDLGKTLSRRKLKELASDLEIGSSLSRSDAERRRTAILKLGRSGDRRALELIEPMRTDRWAIVRQAVATVVAEPGHPGGLQVALNLLCDSDATVVRETIKSLKELANPIAVRPLMFVGLDDASLRIQAMKAVVHFGEHGVSELLSIIEERNPHTMADVIRVLGRIGDRRAVPSLLMALNFADSELRPGMLEALGLLGDRTALAKIISLLSDTDESIRLSAVRAVQRIPDRRAVKPILAIINQTQNAVLKQQCVIALAATGSEKAIPTLSALLPDADSDLQKAIAEALCRINSPEASAPLVQLLGADDPGVVIKALVGLRRNPLPATVPVLIELSAHLNPNVRRHALEAVAEVGNGSAVSILEQRLQSDSSAEVRTASARGLGRTGDKRSIRTLEESLKDESAIRCAAVVSLAGLDDQSVIPTLLASLKDVAPEVRYHAVSGLGKLNAEKAVRAIREMLEDKDDMVRLGAKQSLQNLGYKNVAVPLSRRMMNRATNLMPSQLAGAIPVRRTVVGVSLLVSVVLLGWSFASSSNAGTENATALAKASAVQQARWIPGTSDVIFLRTAGPADIWDATTGTFKEKINAPAIEEVVSQSNLLSRRKQSLVSWTPKGPTPHNGTIKSVTAGPDYAVRGW
jgi:HEAT repeat protein